MSKEISFENYEPIFGSEFSLDHASCGRIISLAQKVSSKNGAPITASVEGRITPFQIPNQEPNGNLIIERKQRWPFIAYDLKEKTSGVLYDRGVIIKALPRIDTELKKFMDAHPSSSLNYSLLMLEILTNYNPYISFSTDFLQFNCRGRNILAMDEGNLMVDGNFLILLGVEEYHLNFEIPPFFFEFDAGTYNISQPGRKKLPESLRVRVGAAFPTKKFSQSREALFQTIDDHFKTYNKIGLNPAIIYPYLTFDLESDQYGKI